jgi:FG-GAP repeat protein
MPRVCLLWTTVVVTALLLGISAAPATSGAAPVASSDWLSQAHDLAARAEYRFSALPDGAFSAPNRAQGLRLRADASGVQVSPRKRDKAAWDLGLALRGVGRAGAVVAAGRATVRAAGERVEQQRQALGLTEWYVNGTKGIEQGFTIDARPAGGEDGSPLLLEIAYSGPLDALQDENGDGVRFATRKGETALLYTGLMAVDASGERVETTLAIIPGALRISLRDQGHPYPIIVDPTVIVPSWAVYGDQFDERFGASVAGAGDVNGDGFADVLVGAYQYDNGEFDEGVAFLYYGSATGPSPLPAWSFEPNQTGAWFGYSVASAGDVNGDGYADVIVGAPLYDSTGIDQGRAFVFLGSSTGLALNPAWTVAGDQSNARFGSSVASAGDVNGDGIKDVIVGSPLYDNGQNNDEGRAFVYLGSFAGLSGAPVWSAGSSLFSSGYGTSVASAGDVNKDGFGDIIVGAPLYDGGGFFDEGRVFVYFGSASGPSINPSWTADGNKGLAQFGQSVASAGDVNGDGFADIIIGAPTYDAGRVFVYHGSATGPSLSPDFMAKNGKGPADLGASVASAGDMNGDGFGDVVIGAPRSGDNVNPAEGSVRVYFGGNHGLGSQPAFTVTETHANDLFGGSVAGAGDVNGDGFPDVIAGGIGLDNAAQFVANAGGAEVILGFRTRQTTSPNASLHGVRFSD